MKSLAVCLAAALALGACTTKATYPGMPGDGTEFHVYTSPSGMGAPVPVNSKHPLSEGPQKRTTQGASASGGSEVMGAIR